MREVVSAEQLPSEVLHYSIPALEERGLPSLELGETVLSAKLAVQKGDVLIGRLNPRKARIALVDRHMPGATIASTEFAALRPHSVDTRFLLYVLQSESTRQRLDSLVKSVTRSHQRVDAAEITHLPVPLPRTEEQRRIANFLDDQIGLIDLLISERRRQIGLVKERVRAGLEEVLVSDTADTVPLQKLTDPARPVQYGIVLPGPDFPGGVPIVKGGDVAAHRMSRDELNRTSPEIEAGYPRSRLVGGDILIAIRGSVGELAVVPSELDGANITQDAARIAPFQCDPRWLRWVLATPTVQGAIQRMVTGATVKGINIGDLRRVLIPTPNLARQAVLGLEAERLAAHAAQSLSVLSESISLLDERKRVLITAAVSGDLSPSAVWGRGVA
ncbi:restriction endonuclease subunit S [Terracoccus luteus]|uniref:restriction endonuclease subunit S n=1 Tax=Terracoccus luteus TaxID=53356 RepID=UPI001475B91E|nr:restriction endonuclease subunit S [Terracoccus luteus]